MDRAIGSTHPFLDDVRTNKPPFHSVKLHSVNYKNKKEHVVSNQNWCIYFQLALKGDGKKWGR